MKRLLSGFLVLAPVLAGHTAANALPAELRSLVRAESPVGCTDYSFLFWDFYRAELWSDAAALPGHSFALSLTYLSEFSREALVQSSVDEMARISGRPQDTFAPVRAEMEHAFRAVAPGDRITAWREADGRVRLFHNGVETGAIATDTDLFLAIWLGPETRHPEGREALLSGRCHG